MRWSLFIIAIQKALRFPLRKTVEQYNQFFWSVIKYRRTIDFWSLWVIKLESFASNGHILLIITLCKDLWHLWSVWSSYTVQFIFRIFPNILRSLGRAEKTLNISWEPIKRKVTIFLVSSGQIILIANYSYGNACPTPRNPEKLSRYYR